MEHYRFENTTENSSENLESRTQIQKELTLSFNKISSKNKIVINVQT